MLLEYLLTYTVALVAFVFLILMKWWLLVFTFIIGATITSQLLRLAKLHVLEEGGNLSSEENTAEKG